MRHNLYGDRVALSKDNKIQIMDSNSLQILEEFSTSEAVSSLDWSHPEFGQVLAYSCGKTATIWHNGKNIANIKSISNIVQVLFMPNSYGLLLIVLSANLLSIYECINILHKREWILMHEISIFNAQCVCVAEESYILVCTQVCTVYQLNPTSKAWEPTSVYLEKRARKCAWTKVEGKPFEVFVIATDTDIEFYKFDYSKIEFINSVPTDSVPEDLVFNAIGSMLLSSTREVVKAFRANFVGEWQLYNEIKLD